MRVRFILRFLLILLVSILFNVSSRLFVTSDFWSLQWGKTDWIQFAPVIVFSKTDCPLVWKLVEYTFNNWTYLRKDVRCERSKQTINASQDRYKIPSCWNNLLRDKQIICLRQADSVSRLYAKEFTFDQSSSTK